jgi:hypothetical protein
MGTTSEQARRIALAKWKDPSNRKHQSLVMRRRMKPKRKPPLPAKASTLERVLARHDITLIGMVLNPIAGRAYPSESWILTTTQPSNGRAFESVHDDYVGYAARAGFRLLQSTIKPLRSGNGVGVACLVVLK